MKMLATSLTFVGAVLGMSAHASSSTHVFLDLETVTPGNAGLGSFSGSLNGVALTGALSGLGVHTVISPTGNEVWASTLDGSSPQFGYSNIYSHTVAQADRVGYGNDVDAGYAATRLTISFAQTVSNLAFHIANLDASIFDFSATDGLTGISLLSGNGDNIEGLGVISQSLFDFNPDTIVGQLPGDQPFNSGESRSAYGSVLLSGRYNALIVDIYTNPGVTAYQHSLDGIGQDGGAFTLSAPVPVPAAFWLFGSGLLVLVGRIRTAV